MKKYALPKPGSDDEHRNSEWRAAKAAFDSAQLEYERLCASCCK